MVLVLIFDREALSEWLRGDFIIYLSIIAGFYFVVFMMRILRFYKKRKCPSCSGALTRQRRTVGDKILTAITLNILPLKRYKCIHCGWEGLRWRAKRKSHSKNQSEPAG